MKEETEEERMATKGFILNEVEPWYLGLQNENVGAQARPDYTYKVKRIAKHGIVIGSHVTPTTDPGEYNVMPNSDVIIKAGDWIELKPGTNIIAGTNAHLSIGYDDCLVHRSGAANEDDTDNNHGSNQKKAANTDSDWNAAYYTAPDINDFIAFPNPSSSKFTIASLKSVPISSIEIYDLNGKLRYSLKDVNQMRLDIHPEFEKGVYILKVYTIEKQWQTKLMKL